MSLSNQIFSLREAIIKAKRKAKNQSSSQQKSSSSQENSIDKKQQSKKNLTQSKFQQNSSQVFSKKHLSHEKSLNDEQKIDTIAKDLYSSRKNRVFQSQNKSSQKRPHLTESNNRSPLTYSNTFRPANDQQESRVSNFTVNSKISSKTRIHEKLSQLRKILLEKPSTTLELNNFDIYSKKGEQNCAQDLKESSLHEFSCIGSNLEDQILYTQYAVSNHELQIPSLFEKIKGCSKKIQKGWIQKKKEKTSIQDMIAEWKQLKGFHYRKAEIQGY